MKSTSSTLVGVTPETLTSASPSVRRSCSWISVRVSTCTDCGTWISGVSVRVAALVSGAVYVSRAPVTMISPVQLCDVVTSEFVDEVF